MKRLLPCAFIGLYLSYLSFGIVAHTFQTWLGWHPAMYYVVWDMFCGWSAWASRTHLVAEGESGTFYRLDSPPWGEFHPYGRLSRANYDPWNRFSGVFAQSVLRHTRHEPIRRVLVIEESWSKKYNLGEQAWSRRFDEAQQRYAYFNVRHVYDDEGTLLSTRPSWCDQQATLAMTDNPRLRLEAQQNRPFLALHSAVASPRPQLPSPTPVECPPVDGPAAPRGDGW
jgi:hypothetical protein